MLLKFYKLYLFIGNMLSSTSNFCPGSLQNKRGKVLKKKKKRKCAKDKEAKLVV